MSLHSNYLQLKQKNTGNGIYLSTQNKDDSYIRIQHDNYQSLIKPNSTTVTKENSMDYKGWNLDMKLSKFRTNADWTGIKIPYYLFEDKPKADFYKFSKQVCGSKNGVFSDEDGKLFVLGQAGQGSHLFICIAGYGRRVVME